LKFFFTKFFLIGCLLFIYGCSPFGSGSLKNFISIKKNQRNINVVLPKGYCLDENVGVSATYVKTQIITNCVSIKGENGSVYGRRPVDTVISLTVTDMKLPSSLSEKDFLNSLTKDSKLEFLLTNSNSMSLKVRKKIVRNGIVILDLQPISSVSSVKKVRKYIFLVGQRITIMTIANLDKKMEPEYRKFELFVKSLKSANS